MTAFIAVLLSGILLFQNMFFTLTKYQGAQGMLSETLEQSAYSVLAEFDGSVKEQYGLYMLYQDGDLLKNKITNSLQKNLDYEREFGLLDVHLEQMQVTAEGFSTLKHLEQQILDHCKYAVPLATIEEFLNRAGGLMDFLQGDATDFVLADVPVTEEYDEGKEYDTAFYDQFDLREEAQETIKQLQEEKSEGTTISDTVFHTLPSQILTTNIHGKWEGVRELFENLNAEDGSLVEKAKACMREIGVKGLGTSIYEDYLINEYILSVFNNRTQNNRTESFLNWETEYIIFGSPVDQSNKTYANMLILLIRFLLNTIFIYQQENFVTIADIAGYLATVPVGFQGQPVVKHGILTSWSFAESWRDCDLLLEGKKVPIYKTEDTWHYWFSYNESKAKNAISLYYKDYLRIFLLMIPREVRLARILDLIQLNESRYNSHFQILQAITTVEIEVVCLYEERKNWKLQEKGVFSYEAIV